CLAKSRYSAGELSAERIFHLLRTRYFRFSAADAASHTASLPGMMESTIALKVREETPDGLSVKLQGYLRRAWNCRSRWQASAAAGPHPRVSAAVAMMPGSPAIAMMICRPGLGVFRSSLQGKPRLAGAEPQAVVAHPRTWLKVVLSRRDPQNAPR